MLTSILYSIGLVCRLLTLAITIRILTINQTWRFVIVALGVSWIVAQPIIQYFFAASSPYISELQRPEIFLIASIVALFVVQQLHHILAKNLEYERAQLNWAQQTTRRQALLLDIAKRHQINLIDGLTPIVITGNAELGTTMASVWLFDETKTCITSVLSAKNNTVSFDRVRIAAKDQPDYFAALDKSGSIVANDARTHPATKRLKSSYLVPNDIFSLLDVPIRIDGEVIGIICFEHTGQPRLWTTRDQEFAHSLAEMGAVSIAQDRQHKIETKLLEVQRHLTDAQNTGQFGSFRWSLETGEMIWSGDVMKFLGYKKGVKHNFRQDILPNVVESDASTFLETLTEAREQQKPYRLRITTIPNKGSRRLEIRGNYIEGLEGQLGSFEGTVQDITEQTQIETENRNLENRLIQSQKMETIGTMAGGIAHDFNNILTPILGYADMALSELNNDSSLYQPLQEILHSSLRAKDLIEQILVFSHRLDGKKETVDLAQTIESSLRLLRSTKPNNVTIKLEIDKEAKKVRADPTQMVQIIVNLCTNAWHAMKDIDGELTIALGTRIWGNQEMTVLKISDNGHGISDEDQKNIFEPFYTTKVLGEGTGLGLSIVQSIVTKISGHIEIQSTEGVGTTFTILIPAIEAHALYPAPEKPHQATSQTASILVVDDDETVAGTLHSMLKTLGYKVDIYLDGEDALSTFEQNPTGYDALVTDFNMPVMSGVELSRRVREIEPKLPILMLSEQAEEVIMRQTAELGNCQILSKPILQAELSSAMEMELGRC